MSAFEAFIAGKDRLSALLKTLPVYEAPETLAQKIQEAALALAVGKQRDFQENAGFAPPDSLQAVVLREADILHKAQAARRRAILQRVAAAPEDDLGALFGGPISKEAENWLRQEADHAISEAPAPSFWSFWRFGRVRRAVGRRYPLALGWTFCLVMLCGLLLRLYDVPADVPAPGLPGAAQDKEKPVPEIAQAEPQAEPAEQEIAPAEPQAAAPMPEPAAWPASPDLPAAAEANGEHALARRAEAESRKVSPMADAYLPEAAPASAPEREVSGRHPGHPIAADDGVVSSPETSMPRARKQDLASLSAPLPGAAAPKRPAVANALPSPAAKAADQAPATLAPDPTVSPRTSGSPLQDHASLVIFHAANARQRSRIAAILNAPRAGERFVWRLFAGDTNHAKVRALADDLRRALPEGDTLILSPDPALAAADARLERWDAKPQ
jgi:hypothetical protein